MVRDIAVAAIEEVRVMAGDLFEFRDYHYAGDLEDYKTWWAEAILIFRDRMDVLGLWFDSGIPPRIQGSDPMELPHGSANVSWILRWTSLDQREEAWEALWNDAAWLDCWERHPGFENYVHMSVRFLNPSA